MEMAYSIVTSIQSNLAEATTTKRVVDVTPKKPVSKAKNDQQPPEDFTQLIQASTIYSMQRHLYSGMAWLGTAMVGVGFAFAKPSGFITLAIAVPGFFLTLFALGYYKENVARSHPELELSDWELFKHMLTFSYDLPEDGATHDTTKAPPTKINENRKVNESALDIWFVF